MAKYEFAQLRWEIYDSGVNMLAGIIEPFLDNGWVTRKGEKEGEIFIKDLEADGWEVYQTINRDNPEERRQEIILMLQRRVSKPIGFLPSN